MKKTGLFLGGVFFLVVVALKWIFDRYTITKPGFPGYFSRGPRVWVAKGESK